MAVVDREGWLRYASPPCGALFGHTPEALLERPVAVIEVRDDERWHVLVVRDNGRGVDPAQHDRIFEMFHGVAREGGRRGTGTAAEPGWRARPTPPSP